MTGTQPIRVYADTPVYGGGFGAIAIHSPQEVIEHEDQDI
jgi:hypothetical protein